MRFSAREGAFRARYQQGFPQKALPNLASNYLRGVYEKVLKPLFFLMSPERAHYAAMDLLVFASRVPGVSWWMRRKGRKEERGKVRGRGGIDLSQPRGFGRWL